MNMLDVMVAIEVSSIQERWSVWLSDGGRSWDSSRWLTRSTGRPVQRGDVAESKQSRPADHREPL
jgi:hypothetical protein